METIELIAIVERGEDSTTQFKEDISSQDSLATEFVAFSNSNGGRIFIGVTDSGEIKGLTPEDLRKINQQISSAAASSVRPAINPVTENVMTPNGVVLIVTILAGISKPYEDNKGNVWVKTGSDKRKVTAREEMQRMFQSSGLVYADETPVAGTSDQDIDNAHFSSFYEMRYKEGLTNELEKTGITFKQLLCNIGLAKNDNLNLAGLLLFGKKPQRYRPLFAVKAVSFVGNDPAGTHYRDSEDIEGCLRDMFRGTMSFITRNLRAVQNDKNFNTQGDLEIAIGALEELVANMLLHRDYFIPAPCRVMIFDNRVELISPGSLPNSITIQNIRMGVSVSRNPIIVTFATKDDELPYRGLGTGILRALADVPDLELESDNERNLFIARIPRKI